MSLLRASRVSRSRNPRFWSSKCTYSSQNTKSSSSITANEANNTPHGSPAPSGLSHQHIQNQNNIQKTIEALQHRINTNPEKLEKTLELLNNPKTPTKPQLLQFKFPLINFVLLASTIYYLFNYIREYLDYEETQNQYIAQVNQLQSSFKNLESQLTEKQTQSAPPSSSFWNYFRFF